MPERTVQAVLEEHTSRLMALPGVVGAGQGEHSGKPCIAVFVKRKKPALLKKIPASIDGYPVVVEETGTLRALTSSRQAEGG